MTIEEQIEMHPLVILAKQFRDTATSDEERAFFEEQVEWDRRVARRMIEQRRWAIFQTRFWAVLYFATIVSGAAALIWFSWTIVKIKLGA